MTSGLLDEVEQDPTAVSYTHLDVYKRQRVASGLSDPFHPGVVALLGKLPPTAVVDISAGCHTGPFFRAQEPPSLAFLARYLAAPLAS